MPAVTHVAVTVTDLAVSEEWYTRVLGVKPVIDEDTGPFRHFVYELGNTLTGRRDPVDARGDHGDAFERIQSFSLGRTGGVQACLPTS